VSDAAQTSQQAAWEWGPVLLRYTLAQPDSGLGLGGLQPAPHPSSATLLGLGFSVSMNMSQRELKMFERTNKWWPCK